LIHYSSSKCTIIQGNFLNFLAINVAISGKLLMLKPICI